MSNTLGLILIVVIVAVIGILLYVFPFVHGTTQKIILGAAAVIAVFLFIVPADFICNIKLPIINDTVNNFTVDFLDKSGLFTRMAIYDPTVQDNVLVIVGGIVKGMFAAIGIAVTFIITSIILFIGHLIKYRSHILLNFLCVVGVIALSSVLVLSPVAAVSNMYKALSENTTRKGCTLVETYPKLKEYEPVFNIIEKINFNEDFEKPLTSVFNTASMGSYKTFIDEFNAMDSMFADFMATGIAVIYTDPDYSFRQVKKGDLDFSKFKAVVGAHFNSQIYSNVGYIFANTIMKAFEENIRIKFNYPEDKEINLQFTKAEFQAQYYDLMNMFEFVLEYDLINSLDVLLNTELLLNDAQAWYNTASQTISNFSNFENLKALLDLLEFPIVNKIAQYIPEVPLISSIPLGQKAVTGITAAGMLYDVLDDWLIDYRTSTEKYMPPKTYDMVKEYLQMRGYIPLDETEQEVAPEPAVA